METIRLRTHKKESTEAKAEVIRTNSTARLSKALAIALGGIIIGGATVLIPVAHLITTWAIPLFSIGIAIYVYKMGPMIKLIVGQCPNCQGEISAPGGTAAPDLWIRCSHCSEPLHPELIET